MTKHLNAGEVIHDYARERKALLGDDVRTLPVVVPLEMGSEVELIREMKADQSLCFPNLEGPRTAQWICQIVAQTSGSGFVARHHRWLRESGISVTDR